MKPSLLLSAMFFVATSSLSFAQEGPPSPPQPQPGTGGGPRTGPPGGPGAPRPVSPLIEALDSNRDGVIDAVEIAQATESLKTLDKNSDGKLTEEEIRPLRPRGQGAPRPARGAPGPGGHAPAGPRNGPGGPAPEAPTAQP